MGHHHHHDIKADDDKALVRMGWAFFLNLGFTIIEFIGGVITQSTAIMADAVHDLGDSLSIGSAWVLHKLGKKNPTRKFTYGYKRLSLFGALLNGVILIVGSVWVLFQAIPRFSEPLMPSAPGMIILGVLGVAVNGLAAWKLHEGTSLNEKVLNWHLLEDVLGWVAVLIIAVVMYFTDWWFLDPVLSICFTLFILFNVLKYLKQTLHLFFQGSPDKQLMGDIESAIDKIEEVTDKHHLHLWSLDGEQHVFTAHLVAQVTSMAHYTEIKQKVSTALKGFQLAHTTIEIETTEESCRDE
ncbi:MULTISPECIES: cation diffusion facilitator family transporter [Gammaproteobacteria]|uniref:cation diffusion facilitator family transporter n=1 Tax=Gammaproteobacteria TaxID=1236 RepID=UPI000DD0AE8F|nr:MULTISPECIES: cation diffusion facilitator family transporter [Gammaproteobacteria]RTE87072.1 cation transporter [Aliidiomarina sp. B3213]TCZ93138.1 cation transporter [Lysobacter sp. N42]